MLALAAAMALPFAGTSTCAACHAPVAATQSKTAHAGALKLGEDGGWAFGSGAQAITYVSRADEDAYIEHGLSWYRKPKRLDLTPGHDSPKGVRYPTFAADAAIMRCFQCHSTGALVLAAGRTIRPAEAGVRCESCHGPGGEHSAKPSRDNIQHPGKLNGAGINELCGRCHRMPAAKGVHINWDDPWNTRHQPVYLSQAACFIKSQGKLSCLTCHNPHSDGKVEINAKCAGCHEQPRHQAAIAGQSCASCHMPLVKPSEWLGFANHWIGVYQLPLTPKNRLRPRAQPARLGLAPGL